MQRNYQYVHQISLKRAQPSPLHEAVKKNSVAEIERLLLHGGAKIDAMSTSGTPLHLAARENRGDSHYGAIKLLLEFGANANARDYLGNTPLHHLVKRADFKTASLLLSFGADLRTTNQGGAIPLFNAAFFENFQVARLLLARGSNVNSSNKSGLTPMHQARSIEALRFFLKNGANVNALDAKGRTPLLYTLRNGLQSPLILKLLLKYMDVNEIDSRGKHVLSYNHQLASVWMTLLEHIAKLMALDFRVQPGILASVSQRREYKEYFEKCTSELVLAKSEKLKNSWVSFFNLLVDSKRKLKNYAGNEDLVNDFKNGGYAKKFLIYGEEMRKNLEKGINRRELYDKSAQMLSDCLPILNPDHLIVRDVLDCVSTKDLLKLCVIVHIKND